MLPRRITTLLSRSDREDPRRCTLRRWPRGGRYTPSSAPVGPRGRRRYHMKRIMTLGRFDEP
ncbi:hypothetical protein THAOC_18965, partial [Thalassiosira oceanica]